LLRYEWRSAGGETLVVEAGWTVSEHDADPEVTVLTTTDLPPIPLERTELERARFKAARSARTPSLDLRS
jgi:hypothetical protein